jgi:alpha-L-rhamnosidase
MRLSQLLAVSLLLAAVPMTLALAQPQPPAPARALTVGEGFSNPLGFHSASPVFSWKLPEGVLRQSAYRLQTTASSGTWDSGWVPSDQSVFVPYQGPALRSRERVTWRVSYRDESGQEAGWSEQAHFELGLLEQADWTAKWIRPQTAADPRREPVAWLRRQFALDRPIAQARLYVTARGLFEVEINGRRVGQDHFANGFTSYKKRLDTLTYDVTGHLNTGNNTVQAALAKGWYAGRQGWSGQMGLFGNDPALLLQLEIRLADGTSQTITSDENWEATWNGPILAASLYDGESYDARKAIDGWQPVRAEADLGTARLTPKPFAPVRQTQTLPARQVTEPRPGRFVFDLGQNMVGWARIKVPAEQGKTITLRFSEMLNPDGTPYTAAYRSAKVTDTVTAAQTGILQWEPRFTFHGFRHVELSGLPADARPQLDWVTGVVLHTDLRPTGRFVSSHALLNQLQSNIIWGQRGNFLDIPTDCPQRDERQGWTGDAQVFCGTSMFNCDSHAFWKSWLATMRDDQLPDGNIPFVIPQTVMGGGCPGWSDAATVIPWEIYIRTGDVSLLADNYGMMERLAEWYRTRTREGVVTGQWFVGDWLQPYSPRREGDTTHTLIGSAYQIRTVQIVADSARVLGKAADAAKYTEEVAALKKAFVAKYFDAAGRIRNATETQTSYLLALAFDLIPPELKPAAATHLVRLVHAADDHLRTGFLGTPHIVRILEETGHPDLAFKVLLNETYPSWFFSINQGATTLWERWNSYSREQGFGDVQMNSFNHYAYGAIGQWMYERLAGLTPDPAHPGYKHLFVRPLVTGPITSARAELETSYGKAMSAWTRNGTQVTLEVTVPPNTTATIHFPDGRAPATVGAGAHRYVVDTPRPADSQPARP